MQITAEQAEADRVIGRISVCGGQVAQDYSVTQSDESALKV
jgi:hypothetical protein